MPRKFRGRRRVNVLMPALEESGLELDVSLIGLPIPVGALPYRRLKLLSDRGSIAYNRIADCFRKGFAAEAKPPDGTPNGEVILLSQKAAVS
jgi:hypothetical protein